MLESQLFQWNSSREALRGLLDSHYKVSDLDLGLIDPFGEKILQKRDVYEELYSKNDSFFLNYDKNGLLIEFEVHNGYDIIIQNDFKLSFGENVPNLLRRLNKKGYDHFTLEKGSYLITELKIVISDSESLGGEGDGLAYFYAAKNIEHLLH